MDGVQKIELVLNSKIIDLLVNPVESYEVDFSFRETVHQTKAIDNINGFYIDQWGQAPGRLTLSAVVILGQGGSNKIKAIKDMFRESKKTSVNDTANRQLRFKFYSRDDFFIISVHHYKISQTVDRGPNVCHLNLEASILHDESSYK